MRIIDSHYHWWPSRPFEFLAKRDDYPKAARNEKGGWAYWREPGNARANGFDMGPQWHDLDGQLEFMNSLGHEVAMIGSIGPFSVEFSNQPLEVGREAAMLWNEEMADAQKRLPGWFWGTAALPMQDPETATEVLEHAINDLGLVGANLPSIAGPDMAIDDDRLEPFYARAEELGATLFIHPNDMTFKKMLNEGYNGAMYLSLGRVMDVSLTAYRMVLSGIMERHPDLKIFMSHTGGALPYQSGRMDKNSGAAGLPRDPSYYLQRMYTDTVSPHALGIRFAVDYYGADRIIYGSDYPCWDPIKALKLFAEIGVPEADQQKIFHDNAVRVLGLKEPAAMKPREAATV